MIGAHPYCQSKTSSRTGPGNSPRSPELQLQLVPRCVTRQTQPRTRAPCLPAQASALAPALPGLRRRPSLGVRRAGLQDAPCWRLASRVGVKHGQYVCRRALGCEWGVLNTDTDRRQVPRPLLPIIINSVSSQGSDTVRFTRNHAEEEQPAVQRCSYESAHTRGSGRRAWRWRRHRCEAAGHPVRA